MKTGIGRLSAVIIILMLAGTTRVWAQYDLKISGATTIQPVADKIAQIYSEIYQAVVIVQGGGSRAGIQDTSHGISDIGMVSRALNTEEKKQLQYVTAGYDALVVIVNQRNPLDAVSYEQVLDLFRGTFTDWEATAGWDEPLTLVSKESGRATLDLFSEYSGLTNPEAVHDGFNGRINQSAHEIGSNLEGITLVGGIPGAVSYVSYGTASTLIDEGMPIKILRLEGMEANPETIRNSTYPVIRELNFVFQSESDKINHFFNVVLGNEGQQIFMEEQFVPFR
jgi:phosphate transport system substrate-binding protein